MDKVLQLKITIKDSKPPIWRRLLVPEKMNFNQLHFIIQLAFNWTNSHLHEFNLEGYEISGIQDDMEEEESIDSEVVELGACLQKGTKFDYVYDFGDDWKHRVIVEKIIDKEPNITYPCCIAGKRSGAIEDSGGIYGYQNMMEVLKDSSNEEYEAVFEWIGGVYDAVFFDREELNKKLADLDNQRRSLEDMMM